MSSAQGRNFAQGLVPRNGAYVEDESGRQKRKETRATISTTVPARYASQEIGGACGERMGEVVEKTCRLCGAKQALQTRNFQNEASAAR